MDQYDDHEAARGRVLSNAQVLAFIAGHWRRRPRLFAATCALYLTAIGFELLVPRAAQGLVDAASQGAGQLARAWSAWGLFVAVYVAFFVLRNIAIRAWTPLAAGTMAEMTNEGFARVQGFSAEWHAASFAGATVRRLSRAMWGYDLVADALVIWLGPALIILFGLSLQMILRWPAVGAFAAGMVILYIASNVWFATRYVRPANIRSVALDSRIGGALADSIGGNATVKAFGAEAREAGRIARVVERLARGDHRHLEPLHRHLAAA